MIKVILTWLTIGVPVALLALWDALPGGQRGQAAADPACHSFLSSGANGRPT